VRAKGGGAVTLVGDGKRTVSSDDSAKKGMPNVDRWSNEGKKYEKGAPPLIKPSEGGRRVY